MTSYFSKFPTIKYENVDVKNILIRNRFIDITSSNPYVFLPYTIKDNERPEDIAHIYYGSVNAVWLILLANNITDPYTWYKSQTEFEEYIKQKYKEQSNKTGYDIIAWTQSENNNDNILLYYKLNENGERVYISKDSLPLENTTVILGREIAEEWIPYRIYDYEMELNESRREIFIVDKNYYDQIEKEFKVLINK